MAAFSWARRAWGGLLFSPVKPVFSLIACPPSSVAQGAKVWLGATYHRQGNHWDVAWLRVSSHDVGASCPGEKQVCAFYHLFWKVVSHSVYQTLDSAFGSELPWKCVGCLWNARYVCNLHLPTLFGNQCKKREREREKVKGNYYVAQCVITWSHSSFFSLEMTVLIPSTVMYLWGNKNHLCSGV